MRWPKIRDDFGLRQHFEKQFVCYELGMMKPGVEVFEHVLEDTLKQFEARVHLETTNG